ncbi:MAG: sialidase family protein [Gammaproteobacteria bacterium]|nr:sialidase family protein [Gammaproteobacteria bacterium]
MNTAAGGMGNRRRLAARHSVRRLFCAAMLIPALLSGFAATAAGSREDAWAGMLAAQTSLAVSAAFDLQGRLWRVRAEDGHVVVDRSPDASGTFGPATRVNAEAEPIATSGDNRPKIAIGEDGTIYLSYTRMGERPFSGDIRFARSVDDGKSFSTPITINDNREVISHRFDALIIDAEDRVHLVWIDKRDESAARKADEPYPGAALYHAVSTDRGETFAPNVKLVDHSCECCRIALALGPDGVPSAFWRHVYDGNVRDHALMRLDSRDAPRRITHGQWRVDACPHHGPALAIDRQGLHHFAWFDNGPDARGLFYAHSRDGGATLSKPMPISDPALRPDHPAVLAHDPSGRVWLAWKEFDGESTQLRSMHSTDGGRGWSTPVTTASSADATDHPQLLAHGEQVFVSWNTAAEGYLLIPLGEPQP